MSLCLVLGWENAPCVAEVVNRSLKADCTDFTDALKKNAHDLNEQSITSPQHQYCCKMNYRTDIVNF